MTGNAALQGTRVYIYIYYIFIRTYIFLFCMSVIIMHGRSFCKGKLSSLDTATVHNVFGILFFMIICFFLQSFIPTASNKRKRYTL